GDPTAVQHARTKAAGTITMLDAYVRHAGKIVVSNDQVKDRITVAVGERYRRGCEGHWNARASRKHSTAVVQHHGHVHGSCVRGHNVDVGVSVDVADGKSKRVRTNRVGCGGPEGSAAC